MSWPPKPEPKPLSDRITAAARELKLARRDGSAEWISKAAKELDELLDKIPRAAQRQESFLMASPSDCHGGSA